MIKVSQLYIQNVGPFKGETFDFSVEEGHPDIHIFTGPNGSGKTTILHALASKFDYFENDHKEHRSNLFYKRFHYADEDRHDMAKSYAHSVVTNKKTSEVVDKVLSYLCMHCGNLHKSYEKSVSQNLRIAYKGSNFRWMPHSKDLLNYKNAIVEEDISSQAFKFAAFGYSGYRLIQSANISKINGDENYNPLHLALEFIKKNNENNNISNWIVSRYSKAAIEETHGNKELAQRYKEALNCLINSINDLTNGEFTFEVKTNPWKAIVKYHGKEVEFDVLPDGLRSVLSWMGDLLMRLDAIPWEDNNIPVNHQNIILFLDEIEVHLHPKWQCQILPLTQKIFPNAQIFLTTHSPFIINSIDNAKIHKLTIEDGVSKLDKTLLSETGESYNYVYEYILETTNRFAADTEKKITEFNKIDAEIVKGDFKNEEKFKILVEELVEEGEEVITMISSKLYRLKRVTGKDYLNGKN